MDTLVTIRQMETESVMDGYIIVDDLAPCAGIFNGHYLDFID
jgi:hypothetical protein